MWPCDHFHVAKYCNKLTHEAKCYHRYSMVKGGFILGFMCLPSWLTNKLWNPLLTDVSRLTNELHIAIHQTCTFRRKNEQANAPLEHQSPLSLRAPLSTVCIWQKERNSHVCVATFPRVLIGDIIMQLYYRYSFSACSYYLLLMWTLSRSIMIMLVILSPSSGSIIHGEGVSLPGQWK